MYIRIACKEDIDEMLAIEAANFGRRAFSRSYFNRYVRSGHTYVIFEANCIFGYCVVWVRKNSKTARICVISINPQTTSKGLGSKLLDFVEGHYKEHLYEAIQLEVDTRNTRARALYDRRGYDHVCYLQDYYGEGTVGERMIKKLK